MIGIVEDLTLSTSQADPGRFTPRADQEKFVSSFAVVPGNKVPQGFRTVDEFKQGVRIQGTQSRLEHTEYTGPDGKPHEIDFQGVKLREVVAHREAVEYKDNLETQASNQRFRATESIFQTEAGHGQVHRQDYEFLNKQPEAEAPRNKGGRPRKVVAGVQD